MYDIDRFVKEKVAVVFNTKEEIEIFHHDCINYNKDIYYAASFVERDIDNTYVICWNGNDDLNIRVSVGRFTHDNLRFFPNHGWEMIEVSELTTFNFPSKDSLMEFLGE